MRKSQRKAAQIEAEELGQNNRRISRAKGFAKMNERDRGWGRLNELGGNDVIMVWGVRDDLATANLFKLIVDKKELILDAEEIRKYLRWA